MTIELKSCPFCGSDDISYVNQIVHCEFGEYTERFVCCNNCYVKNSGYKNIEEAVEAWNRRSDNK